MFCFPEVHILWFDFAYPPFCMHHKLKKKSNPFFSLGDNGSMGFWDWKTGHLFQSLDTTAQPGSLDAEAGLMSSIYDKTGLRLICGEADKTSKP